MIEILNVFAASAQPLTAPDLITLLTTLVALFVALERLVNAISRAIRALREEWADRDIRPYGAGCGTPVEHPRNHAKPRAAGSGRWRGRRNAGG